MNSDLRPNFRLRDNDSQRCATCTKIAYNEASAAYCMAGIDAGAAAESGQRVNENFVCDAFAG